MGPSRTTSVADGAPDTAPLVEQLRASVFDGAGVTAPELRATAGFGEPAPGPWSTYVDKVRRAAWSIADAAIDDLRGAGASDDETFEVTVAAAVGAAVGGFDRASSLLIAGRPDP